MAIVIVFMLHGQNIALSVTKQQYTIADNAFFVTGLPHNTFKILCLIIGK